MLEIKNLDAGYGELHVLHNINLNFKENEFTSIIGPNGAGKSTILKSIFNQTHIYPGAHILFEGKELVGLKPYDLIFEGIAYVPQGKINFSDLTVEENLIIANHYIKSKKIIDENLANVYKIYPELHKHRHALAFGLSGGQQQMLAIGRALMLNPKILLLDEPSLGLSPILVKEVFERLKEIAKTGVIVIMVEQNAKKAIEYTDKTIVLESGKVKLVGKSKELLKNPDLGNIFLGGK